MSLRTKALTYKVPPNVVRDWHKTIEGTTNTTEPVFESYGAIGLDWHLWNTGTAPVTIEIDASNTITVPAGGDRGFDNVLYAQIKVTATDDYTLALAGVLKGSL